ncbi:hypothetical protein DsansV1_C04g0041741 [Dioscorea sansibarensis]
MLEMGLEGGGSEDDGEGNRRRGIKKIMKFELKGGIHEGLLQTILSPCQALCLHIHVHSILLMHELSLQLAMRS